MFRPLSRTTERACRLGNQPSGLASYVRSRRAELQNCEVPVPPTTRRRGRDVPSSRYGEAVGEKTAERSGRGHCVCSERDATRRYPTAVVETVRGTQRGA